MALRVWVVLVLLFLFIPIVIIPVFALNSSKVQSWPVTSFTLDWVNLTINDPEVLSALGLSVKIALLTTALALVLGSLAAFAIHRTAFFGRDAISLFLVLPLALPGIITGVALRSSFTFANIELSIWTIIVGHTTFCIVVVYNNVLARLRRTQGSLRAPKAREDVVVHDHDAEGRVADDDRPDRQLDVGEGEGRAQRDARDDARQGERQHQEEADRVTSKKGCAVNSKCRQRTKDQGESGGQQRDLH